MRVSSEPFDEPAPFPGHPFGGAAREDDFASPANGLHQVAERRSTAAGDRSSSDDAGNFDFHLGVYARF